MSTRLFDFMQIARDGLNLWNFPTLFRGPNNSSKSRPNHHTALSYFTKRSHVLYVTFKICNFAHLDDAYQKHGI